MPPLVEVSAKNKTIYGWSVHERTHFARLADIFPECEVLIADSPQLHQLFCFRGVCHKNADCMGKLAVRVRAMSDALAKPFPFAKSLVLYWRKRDRQHQRNTLQGMGGALIDLSWERDPRLINRIYGYVMNAGGLKRLMELGESWTWIPPAELFMTPAPSAPGDAPLMSLGADLVKPSPAAIVAAVGTKRG